MPTIKQASAQNALLQSQGNVKYVTTSPEAEAAAAAPPIATPTNKLSGIPTRGTYPINIIPATNFDQNTANSAPMRSPIFPPQTQESTVTTKSTVIESTSSSGESLEIQVNNNTVADQEKLNLIAGEDITIVSDANGNVTISAQGGGGWDADNAAVILRDHFAVGSISSGDIGELQWQAKNAGTGVYQIATGTPGHLGEFRVPNSGSSNNFASFVLPGVTITPYLTSWDLLTNPGWKLTFVWRWSATDASSVAVNFTKKSFYAGLCMYDGSLPARPCIFIGARYDTDTTAPAISDSTIQLEAVNNPLAAGRNNTQGTVVNTGFTPTEGVWYTLTIECLAVGVVNMTLNGVSGSFTITPTTITGTSASSESAGNGYGAISLGGQAGGEVPWSNGSLVTISLLTGTASGLNGAQILGPGNPSADANDIYFLNSGSFVVNQAVKLVGYPALTPFFTWGNDTESSPVQYTSLGVDFFSFVWNGSVTGQVSSGINFQL